MTITSGNTTSDGVDNNVIVEVSNANTTYDLSAHLFNDYDLSNSTIENITGTTRPSDFNSDGTDVSQNTLSSNIKTDSMIMHIVHKDIAGTLDISGYTIKYKSRGNDDSNTITKTATNKGPTQKNLDVSVNSLTYPNSIYDMSICLFNTQDMSNSFIDISGLTRPSNFVNSDITQNVSGTTSYSLMMNINNSQHANTVDIKSYVVGYKGNNGANASSGVRTLSAGNTSSNGISTNVDLTDLSANTTYDLSAHLFNDYDLSNSIIEGISGTTRPTNFNSDGTDVSQNTLSSNIKTDSMVLQIVHKDIPGTLDMKGYTVKYQQRGDDTLRNYSYLISNTVGQNTGPTDSNIVTINFLTSNSVYDMSVNLFNTQDISNEFIDISGLTRPNDFQQYQNL